MDVLGKEKEELFELVDVIYVDGKRNASLMLKEVNGIYRKKVLIEEHLVPVV